MAGVPLLRGAESPIAPVVKDPRKCAPHQCVASTIDWDAQSDGIFEFEVTIALNMQASSPTSTTLNENPTSFDESNFAAIDARLLMRYCGSNADGEEIGNERTVRVYRARLSKIQHRCNDRAGLLEEAGVGAKFALLNQICSSNYPIFKYGPSTHWFAIAISGAKVIGVDFPDADDADKEEAIGVPDKRQFKQADEKFKRALAYKLLSPPHTTACLPQKIYKKSSSGSDVTGCNTSNINRGDTLLVSDKRSNAMDGTGSSLPNDVLEVNQALHIQEILKSQVDANFEIVPPGKLNHALVFESASFQNVPTSMGSATMLVRSLKVESRWDLLSVKRSRAEDDAGESCYDAVDKSVGDGRIAAHVDRAKLLDRRRGRSPLPRAVTVPRLKGTLP